MSFENVKQYFDSVGLGEWVKSLAHASATVEQAAGDGRSDNKKYKEVFHQKARMIPGDEAESYTGHAPGGVCPFAIKPDVQVYLDESLKRFNVVYPAGGNAHSAVELTIAELEKYSGSTQWVDV